MFIIVGVTFNFYGDYDGDALGIPAVAAAVNSEGSLENISGSFLSYFYSYFLFSLSNLGLYQV